MSTNKKCRQFCQKTTFLMYLLPLIKNLQQINVLHVSFKELIPFNYLACQSKIYPYA